jgi:aryl-phospho-beta-D-glucosidase BglC (GH1 family)
MTHVASRLFRHALLAVAIASLVVVGSRPAPADAAGTSRFGMAAHLLWHTYVSDAIKDLDRMKAAGMNYVRFDVSWRNMEPTKGSYKYFSKLDTILDGIAARGMTLTMTVIETPSWANGGKGMWYPPTYASDYGRFVGALAKHNAARSGMVYEIWNEPNLVEHWASGPSAARYTSMLKSAYSSIKAADSDAHVIVGGICFNDTSFLHGIYANGGGNSFTGIAIHPYSVKYAPSSTTSSWFSFKNSVPQFKTEMGNHGTVKPIWITEFGWGTDRVSDSTRATWFQSAVTIARGWTGVQGVAAYTLLQSQFSQYGLIRTDGSTTASWRAYDGMFANP